MAKLFINKDIVADRDKFDNWMLTGDDGMSFTDIQYFLDWMDPADMHVDIELHSCGGDVSEGYAIYDALRASGKEISATVVGTCASMASVILLAAPKERRRMYPHAKMLIHSPYIANYDGPLDLTTIDTIKSGLIAEKERVLAIYVDRCGVSREVIEAQMAKDSWFGGEVAKQLGFISEVVMPLSAKVNNKKPKAMAKKQEKETTEVKQSVLDRLLAKCGYAKIEDVPAVALELTTAGGDTLTVEREEGDPQVGDSASPDGEHVMPDGTTIVVEDGAITEIRDAEEETEDDVEALNARITELETQVAELTANAKTDEENQILAAVEKAGGIKALTKAASSKYTPAGRSVNTQAKKVDEPNLPKRESKIQAKLDAIRKKRKGE